MKSPTKFLPYAIMILFHLAAGAVTTATFAAAPEVNGVPELAWLGLAIVMVGQNPGMFIGPILFGNLVERTGWLAAGNWIVPICLLGFAAGWSVKVRFNELLLTQGKIYDMIYYGVVGPVRHISRWIIKKTINWRVRCLSQ